MNERAAPALRTTPKCAHGNGPRARAPGCSWPGTPTYYQSLEVSRLTGGPTNRPAESGGSQRPRLVVSPVPCLAPKTLYTSALLAFLGRASGFQLFLQTSEALRFRLVTTAGFFETPLHRLSSSQESPTLVSRTTRLRRPWHDTGVDHPSFKPVNASTLYADRFRRKVAQTLIVVHFDARGSRRRGTIGRHQATAEGSPKVSVDSGHKPGPQLSVSSSSHHRAPSSPFASAPLGSRIGAVPLRPTSSGEPISDTTACVLECTCASGFELEAASPKVPVAAIARRQTGDARRASFGPGNGKHAFIRRPGEGRRDGHPKLNSGTPGPRSPLRCGLL